MRRISWTMIPIRRIPDRGRYDGDFMCRAFEETRNEKAIRIAENMIDKGKYTLEEIAEVTELPLEKVRELAGEKTALKITA